MGFSDGVATGTGVYVDVLRDRMITDAARLADLAEEYVSRGDLQRARQLVASGHDRIARVNRLD